MSQCGICRVTVRKTKTVHLKRDGTLRRARVCSSCASEAILVHVGGAATRCTCGALALRCNVCAVKDADKDRLAILKAAARKLRLLGAGYEVDIDGEEPLDHALRVGRIEGYEAAANIVESGKF